MQDKEVKFEHTCDKPSHGRSIYGQATTNNRLHATRLWHRTSSRPRNNQTNKPSRIGFLSRQSTARRTPFTLGSDSTRRHATTRTGPRSTNRSGLPFLSNLQTNSRTKEEPNYNNCGTGKHPEPSIHMTLIHILLILAAVLCILAWLLPDRRLGIAATACIIVVLFVGAGCVASDFQGSTTVKHKSGVSLTVGFEK